MSVSLAKTSSKAVKTITSGVRRHIEAIEGAREIYLKGLKRLENDYYDRIRRATEAFTNGEEPVVKEVPQEESTPPAA